MTDKQKKIKQIIEAQSHCLDEARKHQDVMDKHADMYLSRMMDYYDLQKQLDVLTGNVPEGRVHA